MLGTGPPRCAVSLVLTEPTITTMTTMGSTNGTLCATSSGIPSTPCPRVDVIIPVGHRSGLRPRWSVEEAGLEPRQPGLEAVPPAMLLAPPRWPAALAKLCRLALPSGSLRLPGGLQPTHRPGQLQARPADTAAISWPQSRSRWKLRSFLPDSKLMAPRGP